MSKKQDQARKHNFLKAIILGSISNLIVNSFRDDKLYKKQFIKINRAIKLLNEVIQNWN
jgi:hypothetical protein